MNFYVLLLDKPNFTWAGNFYVGVWPPNLRAIVQMSESKPAHLISPNFLSSSWLIGLMERVNGGNKFWGSAAPVGGGGGGPLFSL